MKQYLRPLSTIFLLLLLTTSTAKACSMAPPTVTLTCRNGSIERAGIYHNHQIDAFVAQLPSSCDIGSDQNVLTNAIKSWQHSSEGSFLAGNLRIAPYTEQEEQEAERTYNDLFTCSYISSERLGNWLLLTSERRDYCFLNPFTPGGACPSLRLSLGSFMSYIFTHVNDATLPYIITILTCIVQGIRYIQELQRRKHIWTFFAPHIHTLLLTALITPFAIYWLLAAPVDFPIAILSTYITVNIFMYHKNQRKQGLEPQ